MFSIPFFFSTASAHPGRLICYNKVDCVFFFWVFFDAYVIWRARLAYLKAKSHNAFPNCLSFELFQRFSLNLGGSFKKFLRKTSDVNCIMPYKKFSTQYRTCAFWHKCKNPALIHTSSKKQMYHTATAFPVANLLQHCTKYFHVKTPIIIILPFPHLTVFDLHKQDGGDQFINLAIFQEGDLSSLSFRT